jgi:hypothetical protein
MLQRFRAAVEGAFPGRLRAAILVGSRARGNVAPGGSWDVALSIEGFDRSREHRRLHLLAEPFHVEGFPVSPVGFPAERQGVSPELLADLGWDGIPVPGPQGLTCEEFLYWQRDEPDLHELIDGQPVRLSDTKQASGREARAMLAATIAHGGDIRAGRQWLVRPRDELGATPRDVAAKDWHGLARVLRLLEAAWPGCTDGTSDAAPFRIGCWGGSLLQEAEHFAALGASRR